MHLYPSALCAYLKMCFVLAHLAFVTFQSDNFIVIMWSFNN